MLNDEFEKKNQLKKEKKKLKSTKYWIDYGLDFMICFVYFLLCYFSLYDPRIVLNELTWVDLSCFLCYFFFNFIIQCRIGIELHNFFFLWKYLGLVIKVMSFDILMLVKSDCFFVFFSKRLFWSHNLGHVSFNIGFVFYWVISVSWLKLRVWRVNPVDLVFFHPISSFNIVLIDN
jgi:hypothetical protein